MIARTRIAQICKYGMLTAYACAALALAGCSTFDGMFSNITIGEGEEPEAVTPEQLLIEGMDAYEVGNYTLALKSFKTIVEEHPFSDQALLAELKAADSHYYDEEYAEAKELYKGFEERHPLNEAVPYVMFQIGMCDFRRTDRIDRDISGPQDAIKSFTRLLRTYPDSPYTEEARARIREAQELIVNHEYMVAVFYVRVERYNEAQHRLRYLLRNYPDVELAPQARQLLAKLEAGDPPKWGMGKWLPKFMTTAPSDRKRNENDTALPQALEEPRPLEQMEADGSIL